MLFMTQINYTSLKITLDSWKAKWMLKRPIFDA